MTTAPPRFKLLATDLDGTLLDRSGAIHERDRRAIAELQRRGVAVTIVTGRMYSGTRDLARSLQLDGPIGCLDGSAIVAVREDRHLVSRGLAREAGRALQAVLAGGSPAVFILGRDQIFHDARGVAVRPVPARVDAAASPTSRTSRRRPTGRPRRAWRA